MIWTLIKILVNNIKNIKFNYFFLLFINHLQNMLVVWTKFTFFHLKSPDGVMPNLQQKKLKFAAKNQIFVMQREKINLIF